MTPRNRIVHPDKSILVVRDMSGWLSELAREWDDLYEDERIDFSMEWSDAMSHLRTVEGLHAAGELSDEQERAYAPVRRLIAELLPTIRRLDLEEPGFPIG